MVYEKYKQEAQSSLHSKAVFYIQTLLQEETTKFMETWKDKHVSINDGGYYHSGTIIECNPSYKYGNGTLDFNVTLLDFNGEVFHLNATHIVELTEKQYALCCLKKQLESITYSDKNESEIFDLREFASKLDINDIKNENTSN